MPSSINSGNISGSLEMAFKYLAYPKPIYELKEYIKVDGRDATDQYKE
jgi:hypothetical protein